MDIRQAFKNPAAAYLGFLVDHLPRNLKPWGDAMLAELLVIEEFWARVSWAIGGSMVLGKSLLRNWLFPGKSGEPADSSRRVYRMAISVFLLSCAMLLAPAFRQALRTSFASWEPVKGSLFSVSTSDIPESKLMQMAETGMKRNDSATLALVALGTTDRQRSRELTQKSSGARSAANVDNIRTVAKRDQF